MDDIFFAIFQYHFQLLLLCPATVLFAVPVTAAPAVPAPMTIAAAPNDTFLGCNAMNIPLGGS